MASPAVRVVPTGGFKTTNAMPALDALTKPLMAPGKATEMRTPGCFNAIDRSDGSRRRYASSVAPSGSCEKATGILVCVGKKPGGTRANPAA